MTNKKQEMDSAFTVREIKQQNYRFILLSLQALHGLVTESMALDHKDGNLVRMKVVS